MKVKAFVFNSFQENTYLVYDDHKSCIIFDPGCNTADERAQLSNFILREELNPIALINTHCHIDHVLGNWFVHEKYGLKLQAHKGETPVLDSCTNISNLYGVPYTKSPDIEIFLDESDTLWLGHQSFKILFTPGHSPASICFYNETNKILIGGDVLFQRSIGRTDLPGGNFDVLARSIKEKIYTLPDDTMVFPGHGPSTTVGEEKKLNPFVTL